MYDDYRTRSPDRGREYGSRQEDHYHSRQGKDITAPEKEDLKDLIGSPPHQAYQDGRDARYQNDNTYDQRGYSGRYDDGYSRDSAYSHPGSYATRTIRNEHDYGGMYDEGYQGQANYGRDPHEDERYRNNQPRYRNIDDRRSRSPARSPAYQQYNGGRSDSPTRDAGKPSDTVILEGLPLSVSSNELRDCILNLNNTIAAKFPHVDVRIAAARGHRRAFIQFLGVDHAVAFVRAHFPKVPIRLMRSTDDVPDGRFDAFVHYAHSRESREDSDTRPIGGGDWTCPTCDYSNYPSRAKCKICGGPQPLTPLPPAPTWQQSLTGVTDAANVPSQILVVYPLAPSVDEEVFTKDIKRLELEKPDVVKDTSNGPKLKSTARNGNAAGYGARPGSLHRTFLIRDARNEESFKYGFVEFWTLEDAAAAVMKFQLSGMFTVASCPVTVSTIHMGVFVPEDREVTPEIERMSFYPLFNPSLRVRYRDYHVYPSQTVVTSQPPASENDSKAKEESEAKKGKKRKAEGGLPAFSTKKPGPMGGQMAMWQRKADELRSGPANEKRAPVRISLSGKGDASKPGAQAPIKISLSNALTLGRPKPTEATQEPTAAPNSEAPAEAAKDPTLVSYVDRERLMCLICMRKYKSVEEVDIHEKSRNHKTAMDNEDQVKAALPRLAARDKRLQKQPQENPDQGPTLQYRDRAKERREAYKQPTKPSTSQPSQANPLSKAEDTSTAPAQPKSKGAGMLAKMGWTTGAGLGANSDGRTEAISTNAYQEGVGLGAEGGNLGDAAQVAERKTKNSYAEYLSSVQDKARERYNQMG